MASGLIAACSLFSPEEPLPCGAFTLLCSEFQLHTGHARHWSHFPNEQIVFSSSLSLIFEPICAAISSSLFCWPWALSQPHRNYGLSRHWECGPFSHRNDLAEHEEERGPIPGSLSPFLMLVIYKVGSYILGRRGFPGGIGETGLWGALTCSLLTYVTPLWHSVLTWLFSSFLQREQGYFQGAVRAITFCVRACLRCHIHCHCLSLCKPLWYLCPWPIKE